MNDETHYQLLKLIEANPEMSQRELANAMDVSLGKVNYCLKAVIARGWVKVKNFTKNPNKRAYAYYLTPIGFEAKAKVTVRFLMQKIGEYETLRKEIKHLREEISATGSSITIDIERA